MVFACAIINTITYVILFYCVRTLVFVKMLCFLHVFSRSSGFSTGKQWVFDVEGTLLRYRRYTASGLKVHCFVTEHPYVLAKSPVGLSPILNLFCCFFHSSRGSTFLCVASEK